MLVTLKVYGDESADATKTRVFAVAAVLGTEETYAQVERAWLERTGGKPFHASVCESEFAKDPDPQKHPKNLRLYADLTQMLVQSELVGWSVSIDLESYYELFRSILPDTAYYKCLADLLQTLADTSRRFNAIPSEKDDVRLLLTLDSRIESNGAAGTLYRLFRQLPEWAETGIFESEIGFSEGPNPRLEMADLLAREAMKELDRKVTSSARPPRKSFEALRKANKGGITQFRFLERDRRYNEAWRAKMEEATTKSMLADYRQWLVDTGRVQNGRMQDTLTNRFLFHSLVEHRTQQQ